MSVPAFANEPEAPFVHATEIPFAVVKFSAPPHSISKQPPHLPPAPDVPVEPEAAVCILPEAPPEPHARIGYLLNTIPLLLHKKLGIAPPAPTVELLLLTAAPAFV